MTHDEVIEPGGVKATRDIIRHHGSVVVLAVDTESNSKDPDILLIRQYRHAAGKLLLELPAGHIEPGEKGEAAPEEDEKIEVHMTPLSEVMRLIHAGKIEDGKTLIGVLLYDSLRRSRKL